MDSFQAENKPRHEKRDRKIETFKKKDKRVLIIIISLPSERVFFKSRTIEFLSQEVPTKKKKDKTKTKQ